MAHTSSLGVALVFWVILSCYTTTGADIEYMKNTLINNFAQVRHHETGKDYKRKAMQFIEKEFERFGFFVNLQPFTADDSNATFHNVIGIKKGINFGTTDDHVVGIGAHYDTVRNSPGTDDNGSGVAVMLEVARQLSEEYQDKAPKNTIILLAFDNEAHLKDERKVTGNGIRKFLDEWVKDKKSEQYKGLIKPVGLFYLDGVMEYSPEPNSQTLFGTLQFHFEETWKRIKSSGSRGDFIAMVYRKNVDHKLFNTFYRHWDNNEKYKFEGFQFAFENGAIYPNQILSFWEFLRNGHVSFWNNGEIPCVLLTDTAEYRGVQQQCYNKECDNAERVRSVDRNFMAKVADVLTKSVHDLSNPSSATPSLPTPKTRTAALATTPPQREPSKHTRSTVPNQPDTDRTISPTSEPKSDASFKNGCNRHVSDFIAMFVTTILITLFC